MKEVLMLDAVEMWIWRWMEKIASKDKPENN